MSEKTIRTVRTVYGCVLSALLILTGLCFILSALSIYYGGGENPYTPEAIEERFSMIAIPVWITLGAILGGIVLHLIFPSQKKREVPISHKRDLLIRRFEKKNTDDPTYREVAKKEHTKRLYFRLLAAGISLLSALPFFLYALNPQSYRYPQYNESVIGAMPTLLLCSVLLALSVAVCSHLCDRSYQRQLRALSALPAKAENATAPQKKVPILWTVRVLLLLAALLLLVLGIAGGGMADVLSKAINICTECIGLG